MSLPRHWLLRALDLETGPARGTAALSREALQAYREALLESWAAEADPAEAGARLAGYAQRLERSRPGLAALGSRLRQCVAALPDGREAALARVDALLAEIDRARERLVEAGEPLFRPGGRVLTLGGSETVRDLLLRVGDRLESITVCEGRPANGGAGLAGALAAQALPVRLITVSLLELFAPEADLALVGAAAILPGGGVVGAAGTAVLARMCAAHGVRFYVAGERAKWLPEKDERAHFTRERRSPGEVLAEPIPGVEVIHIAWDLTPPELVAGYITEEGVAPPPAGS